MGKINILFIILQMQMGGSERLVHTLVKYLDRSVFNPSVAWFFGNTPLKEFSELRVPLFYIPKIKRIDVCAMKKLSHIVKENNVHVVNAHHFMSLVYAFYACKIANRTKLIYTEHSEWEIEHIPWKWKIMGRLLLNRADAAVGVSAAVSRRIQESFKTVHSKTFTILNGVSLESFTNGKDKIAFRDELGISPHDKVIGVVANFRRVKNHIFLVRAFAELRKIYKDVKLLLIGQGFEFDPENSEQEIRKFVDDEGLKEEILFLGFRSDIPALLNLMDIFCLTSFKEGLPISLIEAMAAGLPVVGTDADGIRDVIVPNRNGFLVSLGDVAGLRDALLALLRDGKLRQKMKEESRSLAMKIYSVEQCIAHYQDLFIYKKLRIV